jgi:hypothetical protein
MKGCIKLSEEKVNSNSIPDIRAKAASVSAIEIPRLACSKFDNGLTAINAPIENLGEIWNP